MAAYTQKQIALHAKKRGWDIDFSTNSQIMMILDKPLNGEKSGIFYKIKGTEFYTMSGKHKYNIRGELVK